MSSKEKRTEGPKEPCRDAYWGKSTLFFLTNIYTWATPFRLTNVNPGKVVQRKISVTSLVTFPPQDRLLLIPVQLCLDIAIQTCQFQYQLIGICA